MLFAPYFHGFIIDKHGATEIRGRLFPAPPAQVALYLGIFALLLLAIGLAVTRGVIVSPVMIYGPLALLTILWGVARVASSHEPPAAGQVARPTVL